MANTSVPCLCGGTFFTQLLLSRRETVSRRQRTQGDKDIFHNTDVLFALLQIYNRDAIRPTGGSFETYTTNFKKCDGSIGEDLKFDNEDVFSAFKKRMDDEYPVILQEMALFCADYIDIRETPRNHEKLVKRLMELIRDDESIGNDDLFHVDGRRLKVSRKAIAKETYVSLPDFLLSIWAYIVTSRRDNSIGKDTIRAWHSVPNVKGRYNGIEGTSIEQDISVDCTAITAAVNIEETDSSEDEPFIEADASDGQGEPYVDDAQNNPTANHLTNNGFLFQQFGNNNKQIVGNVGTLVINND